MEGPFLQSQGDLLASMGVVEREVLLLVWELSC